MAIQVLPVLKALALRQLKNEGVGLLGALGESIATRFDPERKNIMTRSLDYIDELSLLNNLLIEKEGWKGVGDYIGASMIGTEPQMAIPALAISLAYDTAEDQARKRKTGVAAQEQPPQPNARPRLVAQPQPAPAQQPQPIPAQHGWQWWQGIPEDRLADIPVEALGVAGSYGLQERLRRAIEMYPQLWAESQKLQSMRDAEAAARLEQMRNQYMARILSYLPLTGNYPVW